MRNICQGEPLRTSPHPRGVHNWGQGAQVLNITLFLKVPLKIWGMKINIWNFAKAGLNLSQYMVATQENINSRFCSVVEIKLHFLNGGHLPRSGSTASEWVARRQTVATSHLGLCYSKTTVGTIATILIHWFPHNSNAQCLNHVCQYILFYSFRYIVSSPGCLPNPRRRFELTN